MITRIRMFFLEGHPRTLIAKKNIVGSLAVKGIGMILSLALVPLTLDILDIAKYGTWMTLFSIVNWFSMMDIGLGNGFRNRFTEAVANYHVTEAKRLISFFYSFMVFLFLIYLFLITIGLPLLNWNKILNLNENFDENINKIVFFTFILFGLQQLTKNIRFILLALQKTALNNLLLLISNLIIFISILLLSSIIKNNLFILILIYMFSPVLVNVVATIILFTGELKRYLPNKIIFNKYYFINTMNIGFQFFIIQIASLILFSSSNIIITQLWSPSAVTPYTIAFRLFNASIVIFTIFVSPFWSAWTEAYVKNDKKWIKNSLKKLIQIWIFFAVFNIIILILSPLIYSIWLGKNINIPFMLSLQFFIYSLILSLSSIPSFFLAGIGKLKITLRIAIVQICIYIPIAIFTNELLNIGPIGIIVSLNFVLLLGFIFTGYQTILILNNKAIGVWNK